MNAPLIMCFWILTTNHCQSEAPPAYMQKQDISLSAVLSLESSALHLDCNRWDALSPPSRQLSITPLWININHKNKIDTMSEQKITDIDLAKTNFYHFSINAHGKHAGKIILSRNQLINWLVQQLKMTVAIEACGASHHWVREIRKLDHDVILLPAQHVKAYQRHQKNDYNDAQAIAEACQHGTIRPVPIKTLEQQDVQTFLKMRRLVSMERTLN